MININILKSKLDKIPLKNSKYSFVDAAMIFFVNLHFTLLNQGCSLCVFLKIAYVLDLLKKSVKFDEVTTFQTCNNILKCPKNTIRSENHQQPAVTFDILKSQNVYINEIHNL